ncbi:MAG: mechanosensitive ion channel [Chlorobi bacterium]|nr:mechanosensitive ion channel [Chlorobiota bacterium]
MKKNSLFVIISIISLFHFQLVVAQSAQALNDSIIISAPTAYNIGDINYEIEQTKKKLVKMEYALKPDEGVVRIDSALTKYIKFLEEQAKEYHAYNPNNLSKFFLENTYRLWEGYITKLHSWRSQISNRVNSVQTDVDELGKLRKRWELTIETSEQKEMAPEQVNSIKEVVKEIQAVRKRFVDRKRKLLAIDERISEMATFNNRIVEEVAQYQQHMRDSLLVSVELPIWKVKLDNSDYTPVKPRLVKAGHENFKTMINYLKTINQDLFLVLVVFISLLFMLLRHSYLKLGRDDSDPGYKGVLRTLINKPGITLFSILLVTYYIMFPYYPLIVGQVLTLILLINMRYILAGFIDEDDKVFITRLIILLVINDLEIIFWYFGDVARYFILFESITGAVLFYRFIPRFNWVFFQGLDLKKKVLGILAGVSFLFYAISLFSNVFGFLDLAVLMVKVGVHIPEFTVVLFGISKISKAVVKAAVQLGIAGENKILEKYWPSIEKRSFQIINLMAYLYWFLFLLIYFEVSRPVFDWISDFFVVERSIGTLTITLGGIFSFILILALTFIVTGFIKAFVEPEFLKRINLPKGIPAAISVTIRYFLIILGVTFALGAAGIELGKVSLLAGALGIGIGFGLQNIVVNFISGLILVYERPLQVGDTIEVENLLGRVKQIGARSSHVRTYDGAEVVVPNGNLITNQLINWTLSDNKRRIEVKVGTSYGSDPNVVLELLKKAAMDHEDVMKDPAPRALFEEFGDSSLNFRLLFWVHYEMGIGIKSDVAINIFNLFKENGVEIPFPQVDLHVKKDGGAQK